MVALDPKEREQRRCTFSSPRRPFRRPSAPPPNHLFPDPPPSPFIGTPGIIRSEFVFSRPCAVLAVAVSSIDQTGD